MAIKVGIKMVQATTIQAHHRTIKIAIPIKVAATIIGVTTTTSAATISKASAVARCVQITITNVAIHMVTATVVHQIITAALVSRKCYAVLFFE